MSTFHVFYVSDTGRRTDTTTKGAMRLTHTAQVLNSLKNKLIEQTEQHKPVSLRHKRQDPIMSSIDAWAAALNRTQSTGNRRTKYPPPVAKNRNSAVPSATWGSNGMVSQLTRNVVCFCR